MLKKNIIEVNQKVEDVTSEFIAFRKRINGEIDKLKQSPSTTNKTEEKTSEQTVEEKRDENKSMTNNKDFNDDVSVEKFFYYGKK